MRFLTAPRPVRTLDNLLVQLDPAEYTEAEVLSGHSAEPKTLELIKQLLRPGDVFVDVGCHIGLHALVAARSVGPGGRVVAIDPQPANCAKTLTNAVLNGFVWLECHVAACSDRDGFVSLADQKQRDRSRLTLEGSGVNDSDVRFIVPRRRLESIFNEMCITDVRVLKIDVEGHEWAVLSGLGAHWAGTQTIVFELLPGSATLSRRCELLNRVVQRGFELRDVCGRKWADGQPLVENNVVATRVTSEAREAVDQLLFHAGWGGVGEALGSTESAPPPRGPGQ